MRSAPPPGAAAERALVDLAGAGAAAWPELAVAIDRFVAFARPHLERSVDLGAARAADLYLACACAAGDSTAIAAFERHCFPGCARALAKLGLTDSGIDEVEQQLRYKLFVRAAKAPLIESYAGRGDIRAWTRVAAVRTAIDMVRAERRQLPVEDPAALAARLHRVDPVLEQLKRHYLGEFKQALAAALAALSCRQRNLLRYQHIDGLTLAELAVLYGVHLATVGRWVQAARAAVLDGTRAALADKLAISGAEVDSIIRLIDSRLDVTMSSLLAA